MKIATPVSSVQEVEMLLHYGADELYCGLNTQQWAASLGPRGWMNRRSPSAANLTSESDLKTVVSMAHAGDVPVHVTLNAPFYAGESLDYVVDLAQTLACDLGVDSLIVSDINLLIRLEQKNLPVRLHLSSLGSCFNAPTVDFYRKLGVKRIILPRQLKLSEIKQLVSRAGPEMEFEVFALNDGCVYEEGFCQTTHTMGPFCMTDWQPVPFPMACDEQQLRDLEERVHDLRHYRWYQNNCGSSYQDDGLPNGPCSLCGFSYFRDWGITAVKIVGREASFYRKMRSLQMVKAVMNEIDNGADAGEIKDLARSIRATPDHCRKGYMCYFRDETFLDPA
jgi:U32 family peptidase